MSIRLANFESYCQTPGVPSGKARSYLKAIEYLCDYLEITSIDEKSIEKIKSIEQFLSNPNSEFYKSLLLFLSNRKQSSYLLNGFIKAALCYLYKFYELNM